MSEWNFIVCGMRVFVLLFWMCVLVCVSYGQEKLEGERIKKLSLVELIVESEMVYQLSSIKDLANIRWDTLAGVKREVFLSPSYAFGEEKIGAIKWSLDHPKESKENLQNDFVLGFTGLLKHGICYFYLHNASADFYLQVVQGPLAGNTVLYPEYAGLRDDLIWLCRNRYLLKLLKKGELKAETYQFSPHEMELLVRLCPGEYLKNLHAYAESDEGGDKLAKLYAFMDYDPSESKKFPLLNEHIVEKLAVAIDEEIVDGVMFANTEGELLMVSHKIKNGLYITQRDKRLMRSVFIKNDDHLAVKNALAGMMKDEVLANGDIGLLKAYLLRMKARDSVADLAVLAELVQAKVFQEGGEEFQGLVMDGFALRREREVVWVLAPLIKHEDVMLAGRAREIMKGLAPKDLGDEPKEWRAWYREQNK